jgi:hypothetical protein
MNPGQVLPSDPYAWCRNPACKHYNKDQTGKSRFNPLDSDGVPKRTKKPRKAVAKTPPEPKSEPIEPPDTEPEAVQKARARIKAVLDATEAQFSPGHVGLALAIVSQETGNDEAANSLIHEYNLTELYGIQPRDVQKS